MKRSALLLLLLWVTLLAFSTGCAHRLSGPNHHAELPGWTADGLVAAVPELELEHRIVLIGDAGYYLEDDPTLAALGRWAEAAPASTVIYLGDNIYNEGLTDDDRERGERILAQQLAATSARKIVIPGNHDWGFLQRHYTAKAIANQQDFVDGWKDGKAEFIPKGGCLGPTHRILEEASADRAAIVFVAVDPTPWIAPRIRESCPNAVDDEAHLAALEAILERHRDDFVLVASHYPMLTGGPHGGLSYGFVADLIVTPLGWAMGGLLNTYEPRYADWIARTQAVFRRHPPEVYAAGHDHSLQLLDAGDVAGIYVVSGAGARERVSTVTHLPETFFAHAAEGFVVVDVGLRDGVRTAVLRVVEAHATEPVFQMELP